MNDRKKKHSQTNLKVTVAEKQKHMQTSNIKLGPVCKPKQPPNISNHYMLAGKKRQLEAKEFRHRDHDTFIQTDSRNLAQSRPPRMNSGKGEEMQTKKKIKDIHHISRPLKAKYRVQNGENKQLHSNMDFNVSRQEKLVKPQFLSEEPISLHCRQKMHKKIKRNNRLQERDSNLRSRPIASQKSPQKTFAESILDFEAKVNKIEAQNETQTLVQLFEKERIYSRIENYNCYLVKNQPQIPWVRRAIVINWMFQVCTGFGSKREAFALAVNYLDRYLTLTQNIPITQLQLIAAGALSISNKNEGAVFTIPGLVDTFDGFSVCQVAEMEQQILWRLQWKLNPPTSNMWANRIALQWDMYLESREDLPEILQENMGFVKFKKFDFQSYQNFRSLMQYIDFALMDVHTLQYNCRELAASFIYLILNLKLHVFAQEDVVNTFPKTSKYMLNQTDLNNFYCSFLERSFGFALIDLLPTVQYCATFCFLPIDMSLPPSMVGIEDSEQVEYEQFCSLQTHNQHFLACLLKRNRQYD